MVETSSTFKLSVILPRRISLPGCAKKVDREAFFEWIWNHFASQGLLGVHEGTLLCDQAAEQGLEADTWMVDSGEAPRERDWIKDQNETSAELFFGTHEDAENAILVLQKIPELSLGSIEEQKPQDWDAQWKASFLNAGEGVKIAPFWRIIPPWVNTEAVLPAWVTERAADGTKVDGESLWPARVKKGANDDAAALKAQSPANGSPSPLLPGEKPLKINPGAGFGTGTHETTQMCLSAMGEISLEKSLLGMRALDFGSGSGILSVGLALLGAKVDAVEIDPLALDNARENAELNGVEERIRFSQALGSASQRYGIVVANILRPVLLEFSERLVQRLEPKGYLILSGLIESDVASVLDTYSRLLNVPISSAEVYKSAEWRAILFRP